MENKGEMMNLGCENKFPCATTTKNKIVSDSKLKEGTGIPYLCQRVRGRLLIFMPLHFPFVNTFTVIFNVAICFFENPRCRLTFSSLFGSSHSISLTTTPPPFKRLQSMEVMLNMEGSEMSWVHFSYFSLCWVASSLLLPLPIPVEHNTASLPQTHETQYFLKSGHSNKLCH